MPPRRAQQFNQDLGLGAEMRARWETEGHVVRYAVLLLASVEDQWRPVILFDCSHGDRNDRHDYTRNGVKGAAVIFHYGSPAEALRDAIGLIREEGERMIEQWQQ